MVFIWVLFIPREYLAISRDIWDCCNSGYGWYECALEGASAIAKYLTIHRQSQGTERIIPIVQDVSSVEVAAAAKSLQSCPTLCDPIDGSPPGSAVPGILQARTLEWAAISFSNVWKWKVKLLSHVRLFATPWTAAHQAHPSMGFSRQEYWSGLPFPSLSVEVRKPYSGVWDAMVQCRWRGPEGILKCNWSCDKG